jgi:hypothetical protein
MHIGVFYFPDEIEVDDTFRFETMGRKFLGKVLTIKNKTVRIDELVSSWDYQLEASETLTLLWPPATQISDISVIDSDYVFLHTSFELQAHGNINVHSKDIIRITNRISKVLVKPKTKIFKKNTEINIDKGEQCLPVFDVIPSMDSYASTYTISSERDNACFLFNRSGVKPLSKGQSVLLTPRSEIRCYYFGYLKERIYPRQQEELTGMLLLNDILAHYKRTCAFDKNIFGSCEISEIASQYIEECEASGSINIVVEQFIKEGRL